MALPPISVLPPVPLPGDPLFRQKMDAIIGAALPQFRAELVAYGQYVEALPQVVTPATVRSAISELAILAALREANIIVNSGFLISQQNGASAVTSNGGYPSDQWVLEHAGFSGTVTGQTGTTSPIPGLPKYVAVQAPTETTDANDVARVSQPIEGTRMRELGWDKAGGQKATVAILFMQNLTHAKSAVLRRQDGGEVYARLLPAGAKFFTYVIPAPAGNAAWKNDNTLAAYFHLSNRAGTNARASANDAWVAENRTAAAGHVNDDASAEVIRPNAVVILPGEHTITEGMMPLLVRNEVRELEICSRYLPVWLAQSNLDPFPFNGRATAANGFIGALPLTVPPRVPPTGIAISGAGDFRIGYDANTVITSGMSFASSSDKAILVTGTTSTSPLTTGGSLHLYGGTLNARILGTGCRMS